MICFNTGTTCIFLYLLPYIGWVTAGTLIGILRTTSRKDHAGLLLPIYK